MMWGEGEEQLSSDEYTKIVDFVPNDFCVDTMVKINKINFVIN